MSKYLLDTCFILGLYNQNEQAIKLMRNVPFAECCVSVVNRIELLGYHNITPRDEQELAAFLNLATALVHHLTLLTLDNGLNNKFLLEQGG